MNLLLMRNLVPSCIAAPLWGDRTRWGLQILELDPCWVAWQSAYLDFYNANQRKGIGTIVNDAGYRVLAHLDLGGKTILEIGPGDIRHIALWKSQPKEYILADVQAPMLQRAEAILASEGVPTRSLLLQRGDPLPLAEASVDIIVSFYALEHIYPLKPYLDELNRVLKPGGIVAGAIPAEGGLAWGAGRLFTSRRWFKKHTRINPDKIICWEHPNFGDEILRALHQTFEYQRTEYWPLPFLHHLDLNLVIRFIFRKPG